MSSASEILVLHKKILPAKYDKKRQPNIIGTDELPFPICITQSQLKGGHHFHFQHGPYSRRFVMCARNYYSCNVQLTCMTRACSGRVNMIPKNPNMIKCIGERESKEGKRQRIKKNMPLTGNAPIRFEEIQLFATNTEWYSENILDIALTLHSPEENILTFPDFIPSSSELTYTVL